MRPTLPCSPLMGPLLLALSALWLGGCAGARPAELAIAPGDYALAFDAARETLRDARYTIDRVDARAGVLTTAPQASAGVALPGGAEPAGLSAEDLINRQARRVRITFEPEGAPAGTDLLDAEPAPLVMRVRVLVEREHRPGLRLESSSIRLNSRSVDPELVGRGMQPSYAVVLREDPEMSGVLTGKIAERLQRATR